MNVLLVRPPSSKATVIMPNLGLGYLASVLRKDGHNVAILDCVKEKMDHSRFEKYLAGRKTDALGIQVFTCDFSSSKECLDLVKRLDRNTVTFVGGPHPSGDPAGTLDGFTNADFAFVGESELGLPKLLSRIARGVKSQLDDIEGLVYRKDGAVIVNKHGRIADLNTIPFPNWDLIDPRTYPASPHGSFTKRLPTAPIITTRGCPFECTYCGVRTTTGRGFRMRSVDNLIEEIKYLRDRFGIREIHIEDDNFTMNRARVIAFCERIKSEGIDISWACPNGVRLDTLDEELLRHMESAGCYSFAVGFESGAPRVL
ncbi:MAG: radical SAM protein, partial [Candidatus Omnitrophota bacterium]